MVRISNLYIYIYTLKSYAVCLGQKVSGNPVRG